MCLETEQAIERDRGIFFHVVDSQHAVNPCANARAFAENAVFVPIPILHHRLERGLIHRHGDFRVSAVLVPDRAPIADSGIHLVSGHVPVRTAQAAHLDAGICETLFLRELHFEAHIEIRVALLRSEKGVQRHILLHRAADDLPVLHLPPFFLRLGNFPAIEGFPIEQRDRGSVRGKSCAKQRE